MVTLQTAVLTELEPIVEANLKRHLEQAKPWNPHDFVPWSRGRDFVLLGGQDWAPEDSQLDEVAKAAMVVNLLTEDNLPSYHREIALRFGLDGAWGQWVGQWTAEEGRHSNRDPRLSHGHARRRSRRIGAPPHAAHGRRL